MAADFMETNRALSRVLSEQARAVAVFDHPATKGDGREDLLRDFLRQRIGTSFGVSKAEVVDSLGGTTPELDAVIYDQSTASVLNVVGGRSIVRVESVAVVIEIKSKLNASTGEDEEVRVRRGFGNLRRFYQPAPLLKLILKNAATNAVFPFATERLLAAGIGALESFHEVPAVVHACFAFDGPGQDAVFTFLNRPMIDVVCVLGKHTMTKPEPGGPDKIETGVPMTVWGEGDDALGAFLQIIDACLRKWREASALVLPADAYYRPKE